jgi:uncharacterized protein (TIGR00369 family)
MIKPDTSGTLSGLEYFEKLLRGELRLPPMLELFGIRIVEVERGRIVFTTRVEERFYNGTGVAHGGFAATLLDTALGCAINTTTPPLTWFTTLELKANLLRALTVDVGELRCEGTAIHVGRRTGVSEARILDSRGKIYAHGTTTCIVVEGSDRFPTG